MSGNLRLKCTAHLMHTNALCVAFIRRAKLSAVALKGPTQVNVGAFVGNQPYSFRQAYAPPYLRRGCPVYLLLRPAS